MAAPSVSNAGSGNSASTTTSHSIGVGSGTADKIVIIGFVGLPGAVSGITSGWNVLINDNEATRTGMLVLYKANTADTTVSVTTSNSVTKAWRWSHISGADLSSLTAPTIFKSAGANAYTPPAISGLASGDYLFMTSAIWSRGRTHTGYPANYSSNQAIITQSGSSSAQMAVANRAQTGVTGTGTIGNHTVNNTSEGLACTIAVPEPTGPPPSSTGWVYPTTTGHGYSDWSSPTNAYTVNSQYASAWSWGWDDDPVYLAISIDNGASYSSPKTSPGLVASGYNDYQVGGENDSWGLSLTPENISNLRVRIETTPGEGGGDQQGYGGFGISIPSGSTITGITVGLAGARTSSGDTYVDAIRVDVHYLEPPAGITTWVNVSGTPVQADVHVNVGGSPVTPTTHIKE